MLISLGAGDDVFKKGGRDLRGKTLFLFMASVSQKKDGAR